MSNSRTCSVDPEPKPLQALLTAPSSSLTAPLLPSQNWHFLSKHIQYHSVVAAGAMEETAEVETRDRHSLVSLALPNDVDEEDERHLRDEQVSPHPNPNP